MAGGKTDILSNDWLELYFVNNDIGNVGDTAGLVGSSGAGSVWIALCESEPGEDGLAAGHEATYGGYARLEVNRGSGQWEVVTDTGEEVARNTQILTWASKKTDAGSVTITHFGISRQVGGNFDWVGAVTDPSGGIIIPINGKPRILAEKLVIGED